MVGRLVTQHLEKFNTDPQRFKQSLLYTDSFGFTVHAVVGFAVALVAELHWMWIPICSALTCAGGGLLLDMVCSNKPRTFKGHPYEENGRCASRGYDGIDVSGKLNVHAPYLYCRSDHRCVDRRFCYEAMGDEKGYQVAAFGHRQRRLTNQMPFGILAPNHRWRGEVTPARPGKRLKRIANTEVRAPADFN